MNLAQNMAIGLILLSCILVSVIETTRAAHPRHLAVRPTTDDILTTTDAKWHNVENDKEDQAVHVLLKPLESDHWMNDAIGVRATYFGWDGDGTLWLDASNKSKKTSQQKNFKDDPWSQGYKKILQQMANMPPRTGGRIIHDDVVLEFWRRTEHTEVTHPTFVIQMPSNRKEDRCVRLVPNPYEVKNGAYFFARQELETLAPPFHERIPQLFFRAHLHNVHREEQRARAFDMGADPSNHHWLNATLDDQGPSTAVRYRYLLEIGGVDGTTWGALLWKMASGSLVFKVDSPRNLWFERVQQLRANVHYLPIKSDLSNLHTQWAWANDNPTAAQTIAEAGQRAASASNIEMASFAFQHIVSETIHDCGP